MNGGTQWRTAKTFKTQVHELRYNFDISTGWLYLPHGCCTDMAGCIALFQAIDPKVERIGTYAGANRDTSYQLTKDGWKAELPFKVVVPQL